MNSYTRTSRRDAVLVGKGPPRCSCSLSLTAWLMFESEPRMLASGRSTCSPWLVDATALVNRRRELGCCSTRPFVAIEATGKLPTGSGCVGRRLGAACRWLLLLLRLRLLRILSLLDLSLRALLIGRRAPAVLASAPATALPTPLPALAPPSVALLCCEAVAWRGGDSGRIAEKVLVRDVLGCAPAGATPSEPVRALGAPAAAASAVAR